VIGALYGLLLETGAFDAVWNRILGDETSRRGMVRELVRQIVGGEVPLSTVGLALAALAGLLVFVRLLSMGWALVRLYDFRVSRVDEDLRTEFGLLTRVAATIPSGRVQTLTMTEGLWHRVFERASIRIETAGGGAGRGGAGEHAWLAPIVARDRAADFVRAVLPELDFDAVAWLPVHPRAFRRALKPAIAFAVLTGAAAAALGGWIAGVVVACAATIWAVVGTRQRIRTLAWAETEHVVLFRSGWLRRRVTAARVAKIQALALRESPFDRRTHMARLRVDTAGAGEFSHRVEIPFLPRETAQDLSRRLAVMAGRTRFRW
jgi:putative membrane protein